MRRAPCGDCITVVLSGATTPASPPCCSCSASSGIKLSAAAPDLFFLHSRLIRPEWVKSYPSGLSTGTRCHTNSSSKNAVSGLFRATSSRDAMYMTVAGLIHSRACIPACHSRTCSSNSTDTITTKRDEHRYRPHDQESQCESAKLCVRESYSTALLINGDAV